MDEPNDLEIVFTPTEADTLLQEPSSLPHDIHGVGTFFVSCL